MVLTGILGDLLGIGDAGCGTSIAFNELGTIFAKGNGSEVSVYELDGTGAWVAKGAEISVGTTVLSLALNAAGTRLAVGRSLGVNIYDFDDTTDSANPVWGLELEQNMADFGGSSNVVHGRTVSLSGDGTLVAIADHLAKTAASSSSVNRGVVDLYTLTTATDGTVSGTSTRVEGTVKYDHFGSDVSISGDGKFIAIGFYGEDIAEAAEENTVGDEDYAAAVLAANSVGGVKIYTVDVDDDSTTLTLVNTIFGTEQGDQVGRSCMFNNDGSRIVVGVPGSTAADIHTNDNSAWTDSTHPGKVRVYERGADDETWNQVGADITANTEWAINLTLDPRFGSHVAISGNGQVIVASDIAMGITEVYQDISGDWVSIGKIQSVVGDDNDVAINNNGTRIAVSCVSVDDSSKPAIYTLIKGCTDSDAGNWVEDAIISGSCSTVPSPSDDDATTNVEETGAEPKKLPWWGLLIIIVVLIIVVLLVVRGLWIRYTRAPLMGKVSLIQLGGNHTR